MRWLHHTAITAARGAVPWNLPGGCAAVLRQCLLASRRVLRHRAGCLAPGTARAQRPRPGRGHLRGRRDRGNSAIGQFYAPAANSIGQVDMTTGKVTTIARQPSGIGGMGAMASDPPWVVWEELDSQSNLNDWTIHAWSQARGTATAIATSRLRNGEFLAGQQPLPVLRGGVAAWAQPLPARGGYTQAAIRVDNLSAGTVATLDTGRVSSPVYAAPT